MSRWIPSVPLCSASQPTSFAYESTVKRWPTILTGVIDELARLNGSLLSEQDREKVTESKAIIQEIGGLIYEMRHDRVLTPLPDVGLPSDVKLYNDELALMTADGRGTWFSSSWLYAECYMYRRLRIIFASTKHWHTFDPFLTQKISTFRSSASGVHALATSLEKLVARGPPHADVLRKEWIGLMESCLWGNATDLSLLTNLTEEDIKALQSTERGADFVLKNDLDACWTHLKDLRDTRIDIVLDNSGFEMFTDLILADYLVTLSPFCKAVTFHPKSIPWFVSDVVPADFTSLFAALNDSTFFPADTAISSEDKEALRRVIARWESYIKDGTFKLSVPWTQELGDEGGEMADFWSGPTSFSDLPALDPTLLKDLQQASLVIFKDEKLTGDACWPTTTSFEDTLGSLRGKINILSLRTCKADVCVGLEAGKSEELDVSDPTWRVSGKYAVVSFSPRDVQ